MQRGMTRTQAIAIALFVAFLWSTSWALIKMGLKDVPALTFAGLRNSLASLCLVPAVLLARRRAAVRLPPRRMWLPLIGLGVLLYAGTQGALYLALNSLPAVSVNLLWSFSTIIIALFGIVWLGERPTALQWVGIGLSLLGAILYYYPAGFRGTERAGLVACAIGISANAGAAILGRVINRSREVSPLIVTFISMSIGSAVLLPTGIAVQGLPTIPERGWLIIGWLAVVNTAAAFTLWNLTLRVLSATESSIINGTMLLWVPLVAVIFLGEKIKMKEIIALAFVALGTLAVQLKRFARVPPTRESLEQRK